MSKPLLIQVDGFGGGGDDVEIFSSSQSAADGVASFFDV